MSDPTPPPEWKPGMPKDCQHGFPDHCLAAKFDGVKCAAGECDINTGNRKRPEPAAKPPRPPRSPRPPRKRKAHWSAEFEGVIFRFLFDPDARTIVVRRHRGRKRRTITMGELMEALSGQKLLPL